MQALHFFLFYFIFIYMYMSVCECELVPPNSELNSLDQSDGLQPARVRELQLHNLAFLLFQCQFCEQSFPQCLKMFIKSAVSGKFPLLFSTFYFYLKGVILLYHSPQIWDLSMFRTFLFGIVGSQHGELAVAPLLKVSSFSLDICGLRALTPEAHVLLAVKEDSKIFGISHLGAYWQSLSKCSEIQTTSKSEPWKVPDISQRGSWVWVCFFQARLPFIPL